VGKYGTSPNLCFWGAAMCTLLVLEGLVLCRLAFLAVGIGSRTLKPDGLRRQVNIYRQ